MGIRPPGLGTAPREAGARGRPPAAQGAAALALAAALWLCGTPAQAALFGLLTEGSASKRVVVIDPTTGAATASWGGLAVGAFSTGAGALSSSDGRLYFSANAPGEQRRRLFCVNLSTGALLSSPVIGAPPAAPSVDLLTATPAFLVVRGTAVYGLFTLDADTRCLGQIDPATGAVTQAGPEIGAAGFSGGVGTYSASAGILYFVARDTGGAGPRLFGFDFATGTLTAAPLLAPPAGYDPEPVLLEADGSGRLLALFRLPGAGWMTLATVDPDTGLATALGSGFAAEGYSSGVADYAWGAQRLHVAANAPGESLRRLFTLDTTTGALLTNPPITSAAGYLTTPLLLAAQPVASAAPGRVPDGGAMAGAPLRITRTGSTLYLTWGASCGPGATDYTVHIGTLGSFYNHTRSSCSTGGALSATAANPTGNRYFLVVPVSATQEGSYGTNSAGAQRPPSTTPCLATQNTLPCP